MMLLSATNAALATAPLLAEAGRLWYALPLLVSISLAYAATRHEETGPILSHAARFAGWIIAFMILFAAVLAFMAWLE